MFSKAKLAAALTLAALGALTAVAFASGGGGGAGDPAAVQTRDDQPELVRTQTVRRTVHVVAQPTATPDDRDFSGGGADDPVSHDAGDDRGAGDPVTHDIGDDHGRRHGGHGADDGPGHDAFDDHGGNSGHGGGGNSGHGGGGDD